MYEVALTEAYFPAQRDIDVREITVGGLLREMAARRPDAEALVEVRQSGEIGRRWSYAEMLADSERLAGALAARFHPGERVVVWAPNSPEWVLMEYACALAGLVLVTANPAYQVRELRYVLEQSGAVALFLVREFRGNPMAEIGAAAADGVDAVREIVDMNDAAARHAAGGEGARVLPDVAPGDAAQIQYTSGTTGFPKGAVLSHRGLVNNARYYAGRCGVTESTTWINPMPMFHTSGCGMLTLGSLQVGCRMVLVSLFDPHVIVGLIESQKASIALGVPTMILAMLDAQEASPRDVSTLELISSGGAMVAPELVRRTRRTFGCAFSTLYGQTEHSPVITQHHDGDSIDDICNTVGQPIPQTEVSIRRVADNRTAAIDEIGEICARSPCVMLGYHDNDEATAEAIDADGWLHTGDLGRMDARGYVTITGRVKEMIIRGGENHFPAEIENALLEHASVAEVAVVGLPDETWGEVIAAFVRTEGGQELDRDALHAHCRARLSPQKTPTVWCRVDGFPMTGSGKIQKFRLRDGYVAGQYRGGPP
ncbi:MAG: AMP-binding protein [Rhodospirillales bacterium]|nr:AMP-binding protein [Rhodospirillales bacterium]